MATDILGPASAANAKTVRPGDTRVFGGVDTWFGDCSAPGAGDGTNIQAAWLNAIVAQLRHPIRAAGVPDDNQDDMLTRAIQFLAPSVPVGSYMYYPVNTPPAGWLERNGAAISRATYAALYAKIGTAFGVGDGSTTFNLPDDRGIFERGWDHGAGIDQTILRGTTTNASTSVTGLATTAFMVVGMGVSGAGIQVGTTVAAIVNGTSITLSLAATASSVTPGAYLTFTGRAFGSLQQSQANTLADVNAVGSTGGIYDTYLPFDGSWSGYIGGADVDTATAWMQRYRLLGGETRPINRALLPCIKY